MRECNAVKERERERTRRKFDVSCPRTIASENQLDNETSKNESEKLGLLEWAAVLFSEDGK